MKLTCPDCQKPVSAADVNIKLGLGKCLGCDAVFSLVDQMGMPLPTLRSNQPVAAPKHWRIDDFGSDLTIGWRWYSHAVWILVFFACFWDGFLIFWYSMAFRELLSGKQHGWGPIIMIVFPTLHLLVGVAITYAVFATFLNRTEIKLSGGELTIYQGPLPAWGNKRVSAFEINQLYCTEKSHRRKNGGYSYSYMLNALLNSGERLALLQNISEAHEALYLERTLEERLKIADERVAGDWVG